MDRKQAIKQLADNIVNQITTVFDTVVANEVHSRLSRIANGVGKAPMARKPQAPKLCIAPNCKHPGAPRYGFTCVEHNTQFTREEKILMRDRAKQPGGKWNPEGKAKKKNKKAA